MSAGLPCRSSVGQSIENSGCDRLNQFRCPGNRTRQRTHEVRCARRIGRRLQRCANCARHLSNAIFRQQRIGPTSEPSGVRATVVSRLDGRSAEAAPRRTALDVLGLRARPVDCKQGNAARSLPAFADNVRPTRGWRCRSRGARRGKRQRPCASVDRGRSLTFSSRPMHGECSFAAARPSQAE